MSDFNDDPTATYRGYRRQVLYCLFRLFDDGLPEGFIIQPEGKEDLAVRNSGGDLIEVIQVKDYSSDLSVSNFKSVFFSRIINYCRPESMVEVTLAHFGNLGPELSSAIDNNKATPKRAISTLKKKGFSAKDTEDIFRQITSKKVEESELKNFILAKLKETVTSGSPQQAFENLMWWMMSASEQQLNISRVNAIEKIEEVGRFLTQRLAHEAEWNTSILPISMKHADCSKQQKQEFYKGGRVRPVHIANNLDVRRTELLQQIHERFLENNVVIIRAASGQGKTTLAYRYIADYVPNDFRFEVLRPTDIQHARHMAQALSGHSEAIDVPTLLYLDVRPGDKAWLEFVREIAFIPKLRVLITIREEDWFKSQVSVSDFAFSEVALNFDKKTGERLFSELSHHEPVKAYLNFDDAWAQLGQRKTLFEFVYFLTQEEKLAHKIREQVVSLQEDVRTGKLNPNELKLLKLVAVASAYEARIDLKKLVAHCELREPKRTIELFSNEFLLRKSDDGQFVEGFHAIRSEIMCSQFLDDVFDPWHSLAGEVISLLDESDLELFLLCSFSRKSEFSDEIVSALSAFTPHSWVGIRGVGVALKWLGLDEYIDENFKVINDAHARVGSGWWIMLDWDIAGVTGKKGFGVFEGLRDINSRFELMGEASDKLIELQSDKKAAFDKFSAWIKSLSHTPTSPDSFIEFAAMAEVMFWAGHLRVKNKHQWGSESLLNQALSSLPIYSFALYAIATRVYSENLYTDWFQNNQEVLKAKLQQESGFIALVEDDASLTGHYLIDLDNKASFLERKKKTNDETDSHVVNALSVERVEVLHRCIPSFEHYGVNGYGHLFSLINVPFDESMKKMPLENIMLPWLPSFNALARGVAELRLRPKSWQDYFDAVNSMREGVQNGLSQLDKAIRVKNVKHEKLFEGFDRWIQQISATTNEFILPRVAVDEWGFIGGGNYDNNDLSTRFAALERLKPFSESVTKYRHAIGDFLRQSQQAVVLIMGLRMADSELKRKVCIAAAEEVGVSENSVSLSVINGINGLKQLEALQRHEKDLERQVFQSISTEEFRRREFSDLHGLLYHWCKFAYPNDFPIIKTVSNKKRVKSKINSELRDCLIPTLNRLQEGLKALKKSGISASVFSEDVRWKQERALWISLDVESAIDYIPAVETIWRTLVDSLKPDHDKKVRQETMGYYWSKIIVVPLVAGKSLDQSVFFNMGIRTAHLSAEDASEQVWRFIPEPVPDETWNQLSLPVWDKSKGWLVFQRFVDAYNSLYQHVEHLADVVRIESVDVNTVGEKIAYAHLEKIKLKMEPYLQETFDALAVIANEITETLKTDNVIELRPSIIEFAGLLGEFKDLVRPPVDERDGTYLLSGKEFVVWRDSLKEGLNTLGLARFLWITDLVDNNSALETIGNEHLVAPIAKNIL